MAKPLTDRTIKAIKPSASRAEVPDGGLPGLYLVVQPSGSMGWAYRFRSPVNGKPRKLTIGRYPAFGLADARKAAGAAARTVAEGRDPGAEKLTARKGAADQSDLIDSLLDSFLSRHVKANLKGSTAAEMERLIDRELRPAWGSRKVRTISRRDVIELIDVVAERGTGITANRVLALVRKFFNWLVARAVIEASPVSGVKAPAPEKSRDRILTDDEIRWLWKSTDGTGLPAVARLLLLTGQRRGEVAGMEAKELAGSDWYIPGPRTKNGVPHSVPLADQSLAIISASPRVKGSSLVFSATGTTPISGWSKFKSALDAKMLVAARQEAEERGGDPAAVQIAPWRLHDLRRTAASGMARLGQPVHVVEALLNHKSGTVSGVAAVYNRYDYADEKRRAALAWADYVETLVTGKPANVVQLRA